jgi:hypothetical protein
MTSGERVDLLLRMAGVQRQQQEAQRAGDHMRVRELEQRIVSLRWRLDQGDTDAD